MIAMKLESSEHQEQVALFQWAEMQKKTTPELSLLFAIPNAGGYRGGYKANARRVVSMLREGLKPGVPDLCLPVPRGEWHGLFIELKRSSGKLSESQKKWLSDLKAQGYFVFVCFGWIEAKEMILRYLLLHKRERDNK